MAFRGDLKRPASDAGTETDHLSLSLKRSRISSIASGPESGMESAPFRATEEKGSLASGSGSKRNQAGSELDSGNPSSPSPAHTSLRLRSFSLLSPVKRSSAMDATASGDEQDAKPRMRKDKGKAKMRYLPELPEEIWGRIWAIYYDQCAQEWHNRGAMLHALTPLLLSSDHLRVALPVLYAHPHVSHPAIPSFIRALTTVPSTARCGRPKVAEQEEEHDMLGGLNADIVGPGHGGHLSSTSGETAARLVRHLTIWPSTPFHSQDTVAGRFAHAVHPSLPQVFCNLPGLLTLHLKDTLVLYPSDAALLFSSLERVSPRKARIEIRMWDLSASPFGEDLIASTRASIYAPMTRSSLASPPSLSRSTSDRIRHSFDAGRFTVQEQWRDALWKGVDLDLPAWWIELPRADPTNHHNNHAALGGPFWAMPAGQPNHGGPGAPGGFPGHGPGGSGAGGGGLGGTSGGVQGGAGGGGQHGLGGYSGVGGSGGWGGGSGVGGPTGLDDPGAGLNSSTASASAPTGALPLPALVHSAYMTRRWTQLTAQAQTQHASQIDGQVTQVGPAAMSGHAVPLPYLPAVGTAPGSGRRDAMVHAPHLTDHLLPAHPHQQLFQQRQPQQPQQQQAEASSPLSSSLSIPVVPKSRALTPASIAAVSQILSSTPDLPASTSPTAESTDPLAMNRLHTIADDPPTYRPEAADTSISNHSNPSFPAPPKWVDRNPAHDVLDTDGKHESYVKPYIPPRVPRPVAMMSPKSAAAFKARQARYARYRRDDSQLSSDDSEDGNTVLLSPGVSATAQATDQPLNVEFVPPDNAAVAGTSGAGLPPRPRPVPGQSGTYLGVGGTGANSRSRSGSLGHTPAARSSNPHVIAGAPQFASRISTRSASGQAATRGGQSERSTATSARIRLSNPSGRSSGGGSSDAPTSRRRQDVVGLMQRIAQQADGGTQETSTVLFTVRNAVGPARTLTATPQPRPWWEQTRSSHSSGVGGGSTSSLGAGTRAPTVFTSAAAATGPPVSQSAAPVSTPLLPSSLSQATSATPTVSTVQGSAASVDAAAETPITDEVLPAVSSGEAEPPAIPGWYRTRQRPATAFDDADFNQTLAMGGSTSHPLGWAGHATVGPNMWTMTSNPGASTSGTHRFDAYAIPGQNLAHHMRIQLAQLIVNDWAPSLQALSIVAFDPLATLVVRSPTLDFWTAIPVPHIRVHLPRAINSLAVFKGTEENARDRRRNRRNNHEPDASGAPGGPAAAADPDMDADNTERVVGGDGHGGALVHDSTRLFEIEVNTIKEMSDDRWTTAGGQLPPQVCRILAGHAQAWDTVPYMPGTAVLLGTGEDEETIGLGAEVSSPSTSDYDSPTFDFDSSGEMDGVDEDEAREEEDGGETYDSEAAKEQERKLNERKAQRALKGLEAESRS